MGRRRENQPCATPVLPTFRTSVRASCVEYRISWKKRKRSMSRSWISITSSHPHPHPPPLSLTPNPLILCISRRWSRRRRITITSTRLLIDMLRFLQLNTRLLTIISIFPIERITGILTINWWCSCIRWSGWWVVVCVLRCVVTHGSLACCPACPISRGKTGAAAATGVDASGFGVSWWTIWRRVKGTYEKARAMKTKKAMTAARNTQRPQLPQRSLLQM